MTAIPAGLEKDGLVDGNFRNVHFVYHLNFRRTVLGRTFKVSRPVTKGTKHGLICLILCSRPFKVDLSVCVDVSVNPGPDSMGKSNQIANDWQPCRVQRQTRSTNSLLNMQVNKYSDRNLFISRSRLDILRTRRSWSIPIIEPSIARVNYRPKRCARVLTNVRCVPFNANSKQPLSLCVLNIRSLRNKSAIFQDYAHA